MHIGLFRKTIIFGYVLIAVLIGSIAYTSFYEWQELEGLEEENRQIDKFRLQLHDAYVQMIEFSLLGETILEWEADDLEYYHTQRLAIDSMLCRFKEIYPSERIDSLRILLEDKEMQMRNIMQILEQQAAINKKIACQVPMIVQRSAQEQSDKPKRKGFLGIFGKKEKTKQTAATTMLYKLNRDVITQQRAQSKRLSEHTDSLAARNGEVNRQLRGLIHQMDNKVQQDLQNRETEISSMRENSFLFVSGITIFALSLLFVSYVIIHYNNRRIHCYKKETGSLIKQLEESVEENKGLISSRNKAMHTITHELRTPLTAIHGYAELIQGNNKGNAGDYADYILQATRRMIIMLNSLLSFFRLDSGKEHANVQPFQLDSIADFLQTEFARQAEEKNLHLNIKCLSNIVLMGDKERIMQICDNLLSNAVKFTDAGYVSLTMSHEDGMLTIVVEDTGTGISKEEQQHVFGAFERLSNATTQDGFGLGLSIVKQIVGMLGGTVGLASEKGNGCRFTVRLPMNTTDISAEKQIDTKKLHIEKPYSALVLDDNPMVLSMIKEMYASVGVHCDTFNTISDAIEAIRQHTYNFMITDMKMPDINGYEVLELLRASNIGTSKDIPVVVATASGCCNESELLEKGFTACLFKPFSISELLAVSDKCLLTGTDTEKKPDLTSLLAYGDKKEMLDKLIIETEKDMQAIKGIMERKDLKALDEWIHRQRSSWAVIRADNSLWRLYEMLHRDVKCSEMELQQGMDAVLCKGMEIIKLARKERRVLDESICDRGQSCL